jgi:hypothetical protein
LKVIETLLKAVDIMRHGIHEVRRQDTPGCPFCRPGGQTREQRTMLLVEYAVAQAFIIDPGGQVHVQPSDSIAN